MSKTFHGFSKANASEQAAWFHTEDAAKRFAKACGWSEALVETCDDPDPKDVMDSSDWEWNNNEPAHPSERFLKLHGTEFKIEDFEVPRHRTRFLITSIRNTIARLSRIGDGKEAFARNAAGLGKPGDTVNIVEDEFVYPENSDFELLSGLFWAEHPRTAKEIIDNVTSDAPGIARRIGELSEAINRKHKIADDITANPGRIRACHVNAEEAHWLIWHGGFDVEDGAFVPRKK